MRRRRALTAGATLVLAGCISYPGSDTADADGSVPTSADLLRDAIDTRRRLSDLAARRVVTIETPDDTVERTERVFREPPANRRIEVVDSSDPSEPAGSVAVATRTTTWEYDPETNVVETSHHPNKLNVGKDQTRLLLETLLDDYRLEYDGTEAVDGREAHVVEATPPAETSGATVELLVGDTVYAIDLSRVDDLDDVSVSRTVLIDDEYRYPIAERNAVRDGDGELLHRIATQYEALSIDEGIEPGTFTYEPPADAEVVTDGTAPEGVFDSLEAAADAAPYELPDPTVPDPYVLDRVTVVERSPDRGTTTLWYTDPTVNGRELFVAVRETQRFDPDSSTLEEISFDGITAYHQDGRLETVFWTCEEEPSLSYRVASPAIDDLEPLLEIASSIGCS